ncbi:XRE family transcriptional regulator [Streptomyces spiralis]|uniref:XRE family transcriptional regulator n=1 Tax=Streptomyces spiralis TaxID=66376 RepID=A0A919AJH4_9ACTN|nr:helix-turn-helix transcriptional regulator [Streptomyces spiralis]GHF12415.1 XRE family transcriptional regulator [Streptomyces spiralis]
MDRDQLADFLRRRRETLQPDDVGLVSGPRRRTQGLRREEVAALAGMSTDYYARLEQRRAPQPSEQMMVALARALRLTLDERDHLFRLTGHSAPARFHRSEHVGPALMRVMDRLDAPALVVSDLSDTLVQNPLAVALLGDQTRYTGLARSAYYRWFTDPDERRHYPQEDHDRQSRIQAAALRAALTADGSHPRAEQIVAELHGRSPEFVRVWEQHEVANRFEDRKTLVHPELGRIEVDCQVLFTDNHAQTLLVMTTRPGTESHGKLQLLSVIGHQQFDARPGGPAGQHTSA